MRKLKLDELGRKSVEAFREGPHHPLNVVLDNIRSAHNVGSFFRTCDALACRHIYLTGITARPPHKEISKAAIGATMSMAWSYEKDIIKCLSSLKNQGAYLVGIEQTTESVPLDRIGADIPVDREIVLIFGNEVDGLTADILPLLDLCVEIPQFGTKHSFNVAVCGGIVLWHFLQNYLLRRT